MDYSLSGSCVDEIFRQEYWSGLPFPPPGDLPDPGIEPISLASPALADGFFTTSENLKIIYFFFFNELINLAVSGLCCGMRDLSLPHVDSSCGVQAPKCADLVFPWHVGC